MYAIKKGAVLSHKLCQPFSSDSLLSFSFNSSLHKIASIYAYQELTADIQALTISLGIFSFLHLKYHCIFITCIICSIPWQCQSYRKITYNLPQRGVLWQVRVDEAISFFFFEAIISCPSTSGKPQLLSHSSAPIFT